MNEKGHTQSLVPAHPGNLNAAKAGVFSRRILAARVADLEAELASQPPEETLTEVLRQEIAALTILAQAMDVSLEEGGIRGRTGEPRSLIDQRLRVNDRLRRTLEQYAALVRPPVPLPVADEDEDGTEPAEAPETFLETFARCHFRDSVNLIHPTEFDPEQFLRALVVTQDPTVSLKDRLRARRLLTKRHERRAEYCVCSATLVARDELELRDWINELRGAGVEPHPQDAYLASVVRRYTSGNELKPSLEFRRTCSAIDKTIEEGVARVRGTLQESKNQRTQGDDPAVGRFWKTLLSPKMKVTPDQRLKSFSALEEAGALPECTCERGKEGLIELRDDQLRAYFIRSIAQRHYRGAMAITRFPETFWAIRDAIDAKLASVSEDADEKQDESEFERSDATS